MKFFVVFMVFVVVCFGEGDANIAMTNDQLTEYIQTCLAKTKLSQGFYKSDDENLKLLSEEKKSCFLACMFKKAGIIQHDGSVRPIQDKHDPATTKAIRKCIIHTKSDICKLAWCLYKTGKFSIPIISDVPRYE